MGVLVTRALFLWVYARTPNSPSSSILKTALSSWFQENNKPKVAVFEQDSPDNSDAEVEEEGASSAVPLGSTGLPGRPSFKDSVIVWKLYLHASTKIVTRGAKNS